MIDRHALQTLEYPKILALIGGNCLTPMGHAEVDRLAPLFDRNDILKRQQEVAQMKDIILFGLPFPLYRVDDCSEHLAKAKIPGIFLDPEEIVKVLDLVVQSMALHAYDKEGRPKFPRVAEYLDALRPFPELKREINKAIDERGEIKDDASPKLRSIRFELHDSRRKIIQRLENILQGQKKTPGWTDDVVTQRSGRYVISIPSANFRHDIGILHDRSQSGATFYVEPKESVELNNRINLLLQEERMEIDRILRAITAEIAIRAEMLSRNQEMIGKVDGIHAAAKFAVKTFANAVRISDEPYLKLTDARHPLLLVQFGSPEKVVPLTLSLDQNRQAILVTGPNTGGKTVALKTVGLLVLMAQTGLLVPASELSEIGIFSQVFADIGDEQSIELSLSTFSSHIGNIIYAISNLTHDSLVLFDEIGAGTDPKEGAALAESVIMYIVRSGARLIATTHYSQLKTLALDHSTIENASLEFNRETLAPTYHLQLGLPGSSYAIEIAGRLGMPAEVCDLATTLLGSGERSLSDLISSLEAELVKLKQDRTELTARLESAKELEASYQAEINRLQKEIDQEKDAALQETRDLLERTRKETEQIVADIRKSQAEKQTVRESHRKLKESSAQLEQIIKREGKNTAKLPVEPVTYAAGDTVEVLTLGQQGQIDELLSDDRARVKIGNLVTTVDIRNLRKLEAIEKKKIIRPVAQVQAQQSTSPEIHLRGMTVEEAKDALDRFIDQAVISHFGQIYVIHGKGTGTLRRQLTEYLKKHPEVDELRLGNWNEGGAGVTVVKLKE